jgi:lipopolysaccharide export system permease protein
MKKIDWYILKIFLKTFFFSIFLFALIATAIDASEKSEDFIRSNLSFKQVFSLYYIGFIPHIVTLLFPVFVLVSVVFFTSRLAMRSEIVAMLSVGMSLSRILRPFWVGGGILAILLGLSNHFLIPEANKIRTDFEFKYIHMGNMKENTSQYITNIHFRIDSNTYAGLRSFDTLAKKGSGFFLSRLVADTLSVNIRSESISWDSTKKEWVLENAIERKLVGLDEQLIQHPFYRIKIGYQPTDLTHDEFRKDKLKTPALNQLIKKEGRRGSEAVVPLRFERYRRDANAASVIVMTLIAGILASRKIRGGSGFHMALAFVIGVSFILVDKFSMVFCVKGNLNPFFAAWLPALVFGLLTIRLYQRAPK